MPYHENQPPLSEFERRHNYPTKWIARVSLPSGIDEERYPDPDDWVTDMLDWTRDTANDETRGPVTLWSFDTNFDHAFDAYHVQEHESYFDYHPKAERYIRAACNRRLELMGAGVELAARIRWDYISDPTKVPNVLMHSWFPRDVFESELERGNFEFEWNRKYEDRLAAYYEMNPFMRDFIPRPYCIRTGQRLRANASHTQFRTTLTEQLESLMRLCGEVEASWVYTEFKSPNHVLEWRESSHPEDVGPSIVGWEDGREELNDFRQYPCPATDLLPGEFEALMQVVHGYAWRAGFRVVSGFAQTQRLSPKPNDFEFGGYWRKHLHKAGSRDDWPGNPRA